MWCGIGEVEAGSIEVETQEVEGEGRTGDDCVGRGRGGQGAEEGEGWCGMGEVEEEAETNKEALDCEHV